MTGDGVPYVLLPECQTIGGYPRIGTVIPQDIPIIAQAAVGAQIQFERVARSEAIADFKTPADLVKELKSRTAPVFRDPAQMSDLLSYQLISGMITGWEDA